MNYKLKKLSVHYVPIEINKKIILLKINDSITDTKKYVSFMTIEHRNKWIMNSLKFSNVSLQALASNFFVTPPTCTYE